LLANKQPNKRTNDGESSAPNKSGGSKKHVGPPYRRADMYSGRVACCPLVSHGEYVDGTGRQNDRLMDTRPLHYAFR